MKILSIFGTRPEAIKMAPVLQALRLDPRLESRVAVTAQHREMLDQVLHLFDIRPDHDLNLMRHGQTLPDLTAAVLTGLTKVLEAEKPHLLLVHGDTTTTMAAALAAFYARIPCGHVEAGLRSNDKYAPFPEEINRRLAASLADLHFAPTPLAARHLLAEGVPEENIHITGNTVIDALLQTVQKPCSLDGLGLERVNWGHKILLLTCHRRENWGQPMRRIFRAVADTLHANEDYQLIFPLHKNPLVRELAQEAFASCPRAHLIEPLDYLPMCHVLKRAHLVLTDSGGLQEEAPALGKPVLVLREVTERPEAIEAGTAMLAGTGYSGVWGALNRLMEDNTLYQRMAQAVNPYGDGCSAPRIAEIIAARQSLYAAK